MNPRIAHPDPDAEYFFPEGCHILESWNDAGDPQVSIARARVTPGTGTRWHALAGLAERYLIVAGSGRVEVGTHPPEAVRAGDVVLIPPGERQRITNTGDDDLVFYAICTPRFTPERYRALE